jgi:hypothetical protein
MTAILTETGHQFTGPPEMITVALKVTPHYAAMEPIASASIEVELVRVTVACSVGIRASARTVISRPGARF